VGRRSITGGVTPKGSDRIQFDFELDGVRYRPTLKRIPSEANLRRARKQLEEIKARIANGTFCFAEEFPDYRDLDEVDHQLAEARAGRFGVEKLLFHLAGVPTYILAAELASNTVLVGDLPRPAFPDALRAAAPPRWWGDAQATLAYGRNAYASRGRLTETAGAVATAACQAAHAVLAASGRWITNEKTLLDRAGLRGVDEILAGLAPGPDRLTQAVDDTEAMLHAAIRRATASSLSQTA